MTNTVELRGRGASVTVSLDAGVPAIGAFGTPPIVHGGLDVVAPITLVPCHGDGFAGRPGIEGHRRGGRSWAPRFVLRDHSIVRQDAAESEHARRFGNGVDEVLLTTSVDEVAGLILEVTVAVGAAVSVQATLTNDASTRYLLDRLDLSVRLPQELDELITFSGRWTRELAMSREPWLIGARSMESRRGRTSHEVPPVVYAVSSQTGEWQGEAWGFHLAWSGNHRWWADRLPDGRRYVQMGELLHPGELCLEPGESYTTPALVVAHSSGGLTPASWQMHGAVRAARAPRAERPRPVLINTWEAVYFDHDFSKLTALADAAASLGIERYVLDDGWFGGRRNDRAGLGDWYVSPDAHPNGLQPLIDHVHGLGMEFGIWVEPEMVNPDSDLYRAHPEWALTTEGYEPVLGRQQLVLDLANPEAYAHVRDALHALLRDHEITYLKWDMNRDHVQGSGADGAAGTHRQTQAVYRLFDELRSLHPSVEIESCGSGGARIDHGVLHHTDRVWTSDCNDALERQWIQRGASMLIPAEVMGAHIGPTRSHTTGRVHALAFRALTAMFGHLGVEWNVTTLDERERGELAAVVAVHKRFRQLLHSGDTVRFDVPDPSAHVAHGVYSTDRSEALVSFAKVATSTALNPPPLKLPGLVGDVVYRVEHVRLTDGELRGPGRAQPSWLADGIELTGAELALVGLTMPALHPESGVLIHLSRR